MDIRIDKELFDKMKLSLIERYKEKYETIKLNHKIYRLVIKKLRRSLYRQQIAKERDENIRLEELQRENDPLYQAWINQQNYLRRQKEIEEERENEKARKLWEQRQQMEIKKRKQVIEKQDQLRIETEKRQKKLTSSITTGPTHNPFAPNPLTTAPYIERAVCPFYSKTGVCRYNERCRRIHNKPDITNTLLAVNMYSNFEMQYGLDDEYDFDIALEFEESERYENFKDFYYDVLPEFEKHGHVIIFKVCSNFEIHLRGNVYIQYKTEDQAIKAYKALNTRYYAGRMVQCQFVNISSWSAAICGLFECGKCPKGRRCNYLHVFRNPPSDKKATRKHSKKKSSRE